MLPRHNNSFEHSSQTAVEECHATIVDFQTRAFPVEITEFSVEPSLLADLQTNENRVYVASGEVNVGPATTTYKGFFPENRISGLGLIVPGLGGFLKSSEALGRCLADRGLPTLLFDPVRVSQTITEDFTDPHKVHVKTIEEIYRHLPKNRMITAEMPGGKDIATQPLVLLPHSMGGLSAPKFALDHPDEVETLVLLEAIISGREVIKRVAEAAIKGHFLGSGQHELLPYLTSGELKLNPKNLLEAIKYFGIGNPKQTRITKALGEAISCLTADMRPYLQAIKEETDINVIYVDAEHDVLVRPGKDIETFVHKLVRLQGCGHWSTQHKAALVARTALDARSELKFNSAA